MIENLHTMTDEDLARARTIVTVGMADRQQRRRRRFGDINRPLDFTDLDELDRIAEEQRQELADEQDRRHRVKTGARLLCKAIGDGLISSQRAAEIVRDEPGLDERSRAELLDAFGLPEPVRTERDQ